VEAAPDLLGDIALACLTALGVPLVERPRVIEALLPRARARQNVPLLGALRQMADPGTLEVMLENWFPPEDHEQETDFARQAVRVLVDICEAHPESPDLQESVWSTLETLFECKRRWRSRPRAGVKVGHLRRCLC
jgi:hypothetical protein